MPVATATRRIKEEAAMPRQRYFTPEEVSAHNSQTDLWVSFLGKVWDLSPLLDQHPGEEDALRPILERAGQDISYWFDPDTGDVRRYVDPVTNCPAYYTPRGRFLHVPPPGPRSDWASVLERPWWRDERYQVGLLSKKTRWVRIINTLTFQEQLLQVCSEETLAEIRRRYLRYNSHVNSYTWKYEGVRLDMSRTLSENNVPDHDLTMSRLRLDPHLFTPAILLHFNDDLTEA